MSNAASGAASTFCMILIDAGPWMSILPSSSVRSTIRTSRCLLVRLEVRGDDAAHPGVDHHEVLLVGHLVDDAVVHGVAVLVEERAVDALARRQRRVVLADAGVAGCG